MQAYDLNQLMREAEGHFRAQRHGEARPLLEQILRVAPSHGGVYHLYGLVLSRLGELENARQALETARRWLPRDPQIANNLGNLLARMGEPEAALAAYDAALAADPSFAPARLQRAVMLDELGRHDEARAGLEALERIAPGDENVLIALASVERNSGNLPAAAARLDAVLARDPAHAIARNARARIAHDLGEPDAAQRYRQALAADPDNRDLLIGSIAAAETPEARREAVDRLQAILASDPAWHEGQRVLSATLWEDGIRESFTANYEAAVAKRPGDHRLWQDFADALSKVDLFAAAADICDRAEAATGDPAFAAGAFSFRSACGEVEEAERLLARLPDGLLQPISLAKHRLRQRDAAAAEALLALETERSPDNIEAWALRGIAWQLLHDPRFDWLNRQEGLVSVDELPLSSTEISAIADRLRLLHAASTIRVNQSVRGGTQTLGNLFDRVEPEMGLLRDTIAAAVERYRSALPPCDPTHPILRHRDTPFAFAGSWSVRLTAGGFHIQHMHPQGIVSAASYWAVPAPPADAPQAGWLEIGGTPAYLALDLPPMRRVEPKVGRLVLFPSTLHHGTSPAPAGERMSVAFDVVPGRR